LNELVLRSWWLFILALAVRSPQAICLPAVINVLVTGNIALLFLNGTDQINLGHFGVILDPQITGLSPDVFYDHNKPPGLFVALLIFV
jgi:hypothetical protein